MTPAYLQPGDEIRIVSPSGVIDPAWIDGATGLLTKWNLKVTVGSFARNVYGRFAGTGEQRISDLQMALDDQNVKAILCSRGGYGLAQIIDKLDFSRFLKSPKWLIGFSDISILHAAINALNIASVHAVMAKQLTELSENSAQIETLKCILFGELPSYNIEIHPLNRQGAAKGKLVGGNLSVFSGLRSTPFDLHFENNILFIEDIGEKPYHIDRMMQNLRLSGALENLAGLIVGQFSDCEEDPLMMQSISEIVFDAVKSYEYPVCFNFPAGHVDYNLALALGMEIQLYVGNSKVEMKYNI